MVADIEPLNAMIEQIGLAVVQGAVRQHGGQLWLLHRRSGGLIGRMQLPVVTAT
jgi:K+-sensing histidine kinase KdpD